MPPAPSPGSQTARVTVAERAARVRFRRAVALMLMTLVLPGSAQLVAGNRRVGLIALRIWAVLLLSVLTAAVVALVRPTTYLDLAFDPAALLLLRLLLMSLAVAWAYLFIDAWR